MLAGIISRCPKGSREAMKACAMVSLTPSESVIATKGVCRPRARRRIAPKLPVTLAACGVPARRIYTRRHAGVGKTRNIAERRRHTLGPGESG